MKCPNCGVELSEGTLYCQQCGEDIHIVPVFEPEVEITIEESLDQIRESAFPEEKRKSAKKNNKRRSRLNIASSFLIIFSIGFIGFAFYFMDHSEDFQVGRGHHFYETGNLTRAVSNYERAEELNPDNISTKLALAYCYYDMADFEEFESIVWEIIEFPGVTEQDMITAYNCLLSYHIEQNDYEKIDKILTGCNNEYIVNNYAGYIVNEPEFSYSAGHYNEIIPLKLSCVTKGTIYYTLDGSDPNLQSSVYEGGTIFLSGGTSHVVKAIVVSEYGVISDCVTAEYEIEVQKPSSPDVYPLSGEYTEREPIVIEVEDYEKVYYTIDGSIPTTSSFLYNKSLTMDNGYHMYRFIKVDEDGIASDYVEREYIVAISTPLETEVN